MIIERVRAGMANAKAKGQKIGRTKKRNSTLICSLVDANLSYREIARIAKCSHGSVHAGLVAYRKEKEETEKQRLAKLQDEVQNSIKDKPLEEIKQMNMGADVIRKVEQSIEETAKVKVTELQGQYYETYD